MQLELKNFISKLVWHELGHLCVNLMLIEYNHNFKVEEIGFTYSASEKIWKCFVKCKNIEISSNSILIRNENHNELCFTILNDFAGAVFESVFCRRYERCNIKVKDVFSKGSAMNDCYQFRTLLSQLFEKENYNKMRDKLVNEILNYFLEMVLLNESFIDGINEISKSIIERILKDFNDEFDYQLLLNLNEVETLSIQLYQLLEISKLEKSILKLKDLTSIIIKHT